MSQKFRGLGYSFKNQMQQTKTPHVFNPASVLIHKEHIFPPGTSLQLILDTTFDQVYTVFEHRIFTLRREFQTTQKFPKFRSFRLLLKKRTDFIHLFSIYHPITSISHQLAKSNFNISHMHSSAVPCSDSSCTSQQFYQKGSSPDSETFPSNPRSTQPCYDT